MTKNNIETRKQQRMHTKSSHHFRNNAVSKLSILITKVDSFDQVMQPEQNVAKWKNSAIDLYALNASSKYPDGLS